MSELAVLLPPGENAVGTTEVLVPKASDTEVDKQSQEIKQRMIENRLIGILVNPEFIENPLNRIPDVFYHALPVEFTDTLRAKVICNITNHSITTRHFQRILEGIPSALDAPVSDETLNNAILNEIMSKDDFNEIKIDSEQRKMYSVTQRLKNIAEEIEKDEQAHEMKDFITIALGINLENFSFLDIQEFMNKNGKTALLYSDFIENILTKEADHMERINKNEKESQEENEVTQSTKYAGKLMRYGHVSERLGKILYADQWEYWNVLRKMIDEAEFAWWEYWNVLRKMIDEPEFTQMGISINPEVSNSNEKSHLDLQEEPVLEEVSTDSPILVTV